MVERAFAPATAFLLAVFSDHAEMSADGSHANHGAACSLIEIRAAALFCS
jgi:hypothetical protein